MSATLAPKPVDVGPRVRALREAMDLSLRDLADRSGVRAPTSNDQIRAVVGGTL